MPIRTDQPPTVDVTIDVATCGPDHADDPSQLFAALDALHGATVTRTGTGYQLTRHFPAPADAATALEAFDRFVAQAPRDARASVLDLVGATSAAIHVAELLADRYGTDRGPAFERDRDLYAEALEWVTPYDVPPIVDLITAALEGRWRPAS